MNEKTIPITIDQAGEEQTESSARAIVAVEQESKFLTNIQERILSDDLLPEKFNQFLDIRDRIINKRKEEAFIQALSVMQPEIPIIGKDKQNTNTKAKYASYEAIMEQVAPIIGRHGFSLTFNIRQDASQITVTGRLAHRTGHAETVSITLPVDTGPGRNNVQAVGSTISYGKRYTSSMLLNISTTEEDDDGNTGGGQPARALDCLTDDQVENLDLALTSIGGDSKKDLLNWLGLAGRSLFDIKAKDYEKAKQGITNAATKRGVKIEWSK